MTRFFLFFIIVIVFFSPISFANPVPYYRLTFEECVGLALKQNEEIKAVHQDIEAVIAKKIEATKRYVPVIKYKYRVAPVPQDLDNPTESLFQGDISILNAFKLEMGAPVYTFGRLHLGQVLADLGVDFKTLEKQKKENEIALNLYKLYQGVLLARELKDLIFQGLDSVEGKITELEKEETVDQVQILKLKVLLYEAERRLQEANTKELIALATMKVLMGLEDDVDFDLKDTSLKQEIFVVKNFEKVLEEAKTYRPEYQQMQTGLALARKKVELEKKEYFPNLGVGAFGEIGVTPGVIGDEDDNDFVNPFNYKRAGIGMELSGELDFRKTKARVNEAKANYLKAVAQKRAASRGLELDLKRAYLELQRHQFLLSRAEKDTRAARQIVFLTKSNVDVGIGEKKDYLDALQSYLVFQGRAYEAIFNYNSAVADCKARMGQLYPGQK